MLPASETLRLTGRYDPAGTIHWQRNAEHSPIMAVAGVGWTDDGAALATIVTAATILGWRVVLVVDDGAGCTLDLERPSSIRASGGCPKPQVAA